MKDLIQETRERALRKALNDEDLRIFLWDWVFRVCGVFDREYAHNATAYSQLARQQLGKILLAELKYVDPRLTFQAETEYENLRARAADKLAERRERQEDENLRRMLDGE